MTTTKSKWLGYAEKGVKVLSEAAEVAVHLSTKPGAIGLIAVGARLLNAVNTLKEQDPNTFFNDWVYVQVVEPLGDFVHACCRTAGLLRGEDIYRDSGGKIVTAKIGEARAGWIEYDSSTVGPYVAPGNDVAEAISVIREFLWTMFDNAVKYQGGDHPALVNDDIDRTLPSETANAIWQKQQAFLGCGYHRTLLLQGEPGVGKSHIARHITDLAGGKRLRFNARTLECMYGIGNVIDFLRPSGVIIDDLDRVASPEGILDEFDEIKAKTDLFIVTVNSTKKLDPAILRRFDEVIQINKLDDGVLDQMLSGISTEIAAKLKLLPIVYIDRYREAHQALGSVLAEEELDRLIAQRDLVQEMSTEDGWG